LNDSASEALEAVTRNRHAVLKREKEIHAQTAWALVGMIFAQGDRDRRTRLGDDHASLLTGGLSNKARMIRAVRRVSWRTLERRAVMCG
jgi:hypothetical protein